LLRLPDIDDDLAERILENRPYRSKYDLLNRLVVPGAVYRGISHRISVSDHAAHDAIMTS
jgi:DNA uptake protein ComE-like DNA-binding protein